ncbi:MAG: hypothetical protein ACRCYQ_08080 [Nocardioides sp.]
MPRSLLLASGSVVVAAVVMGVLGALRTGISWDEPYHVMRLDNFLDHGTFALDWTFAGDGPVAPHTNTAVYGPVAMLLLHGLGVLAGVEDWQVVSTTPAAYDVRHLGVLAIGAAGTAAAAGITRVLWGSWRWALVTAAVLLALPMWTGHLMFNIKDVPVATGYTLMTLALVAIVPPARGRRLARVGCLAAGIVLMAGTRPAMATAVAAALAVGGAGLVMLAGRHRGVRAAAGEAVAGVLAATAALLALYPTVFANPTVLVQSAEQSASFRDGANASYGYVPFHVLAGIPILLQGFFLVGLIACVRMVRRLRGEDGPQAIRLALVGTQLAALPLVAIVMHSDLYNGLRQLLFAAPAWAIITTAGLARALAWVPAPPGPRRPARRATARWRARVSSRLPGTIPLLAVVALVGPAVVQATLFPYQYTYLNAALDATGIRVSSDYWRTSVPELLPRIPTDGQIVCGPTRTGNEERPETMVAGRYSSDSSVDCRIDPLGPLSSAWAAEGKPIGDRLPRGRFYALIDRDHPVPANCDRLAGVTRSRHGREIHMTYLARCHLDPAPLDASPVAFEQSPSETGMAPRSWSYAAEGWVMRDSTRAIDAPGRAASLTFAIPSACAATTCVLRMDADAPADLTATVNGAPARVDVTPGRVGIRLPQATSTGWVTVARGSGAPLDLRVRAIRLAPMSGRPEGREFR